jgi:hypothetical protein
MDVFVLWHVHEFPDGEEDAKLIGIYSSWELADEAKQRALSQPGFREAPDGFCIDRYAVNQDHWTEGYITQTHEEVIRQWREAKEEVDSKDRAKI